MMDFILDQQAQFSADMQKLEESQKRAEARHERAEARLDTGSYKIDRLERIMKLMVQAGMRARSDFRERSEKSEREFAELRELIARRERAQEQSDRRLDALIDLVREQRNGTR
jgi:hypothetical protein